MTDMENLPLISVVVPIYNIEDCLEKCVHSIIGQTYKHLEILLVDDGSTDHTGALCERLAETDDRIRVFHKPNGGSSSARNLGIREAKGDYIGFVDSDDFIEPDMYRQMVEYLLEHDLQMVQISRDEINEDGTKRPDVCRPPSDKIFVDSKTFLEELLMHRGDCSFCTKLTAKELFAGWQFPEGVLNEDFYLLVHLLPAIKGVGILPMQGYHVFYRLGSNTRKKAADDFSRVFTDIVNNGDMVQEIVDRDYPQLHARAIRFNLVQRLDYMLHIPVSRMVDTDTFYVAVKKYLRTHWKDTLTNPYLTGRNRLYLLLLTVAPKAVRSLHKKVKRL